MTSIFFSMFFIVEGKLCKVQVHILSVLPTLEVLLHHCDGGLWQGICCQTSSIQYFSSATSCGNIIVLFKDLYKVKILSTLPRQILEQDLWLFCLTSVLMFTVSDIFVWATRLNLPLKIKKRKNILKVQLIKVLIFFCCLWMELKMTSWEGGTLFFKCRIIFFKL